MIPSAAKAILPLSTGSGILLICRSLPSTFLLSDRMSANPLTSAAGNAWLRREAHPSSVAPVVTTSSTIVILSDAIGVKLDDKLTVLKWVCAVGRCARLRAKAAFCTLFVRSSSLCSVPRNEWLPSAAVNRPDGQMPLGGRGADPGAGTMVTSLPKKSRNIPDCTCRAMYAAAASRRRPSFTSSIILRASLVRWSSPGRVRPGR